MAATTPPRSAAIWSRSRATSRRARRCASSATTGAPSPPTPRSRWRPRAFSHLGDRRRAAPAAWPAPRFATPAQLRRSWYMGLFQLPRRRRAPSRRRRLRLRRSLMARLVAVVRSACRRDRRRQRTPSRPRARSARLLPRDLLARRAVDRALACVGARACRRCTCTASRTAAWASSSPTASSARTPARSPSTALAGGHFVHQQAVEQFNAILVEFLRHRFPPEERGGYAKNAVTGGISTPAPWPRAPVSGHRLQRVTDVGYEGISKVQPSRTFLDSVAHRLHLIRVGTAGSYNRRGGRKCSTRGS